MALKSLSHCFRMCDTGVCLVQRVPSLSKGYMFNSPPYPPAGIYVCVWVCKLNFASKKHSFTIPFRRTQINSSIWLSRVQKSMCVNGDCSAHIWGLLFGCKSWGKSRSVQLILNLLCQSYSLILGTLLHSQSQISICTLIIFLLSASGYFLLSVQTTCHWLYSLHFLYLVKLSSNLTFYVYLFQFECLGYSPRDVSSWSCGSATFCPSCCPSLSPNPQEIVSYSDFHC